MPVMKACCIPYPPGTDDVKDSIPVEFKICKGSLRLSTSCGWLQGHLHPDNITKQYVLDLKGSSGHLKIKAGAIIDLQIRSHPPKGSNWLGFGKRYTPMYWVQIEGWKYDGSIIDSEDKLDAKPFTIEDVRGFKVDLTIASRSQYYKYYK